MMKRRIAVDCDHVIVDLNEEIRLFVNDVYGEAHTPEDYSVTGEYKHYWERVWNMPDNTKSDRYARFIEAGRLRHARQMPRAIEILNILKQNYSLVLVTARTKAEVESTQYWISHNVPSLFDEVVFMYDQEAASSKGDICLSLGAQFLIDDNYDHCRLAQECGVQSLLFGDYGWNRSIEVGEHIARVKDWRAVEDFFNERK